ncbi:MAG: glycosyltransferase, partial [Planctomycetes bacterium]|nr:glycosyltransferase [Planctomycetota bacterium]
AGAVERAAYVPFRRLLPRSRLLVHHGGIGTASAALAAGIPQVIVPLAFDQFDNTDRFAALGVARKVPRSLFQPRRAAREIERLLGSQEVADRCKRLQARVDPEGALRRACEAAEGLGDRSATRLTGA